MQFADRRIMMDRHYSANKCFSRAAYTPECTVSITNWTTQTALLTSFFSFLDRNKLYDTEEYLLNYLYIEFDTL
jgi:hypothetical protein